MARRRSRSKGNTAASKPTEHIWYPSSPTRPPKTTLHLVNGERFAILSFAELWAAAACIAEMIDEDYEVISDRMIRCDNGVIIRSPHMPAILESDIPDDFEFPECTQRTVMHAIKSEEPLRIAAMPKPKGPKADTSGMKGVPDIAEALNVESRIVRKVLRSMMSKPKEGWHWNSTDFDAVVDKVRAKL